MAYLGDARQNNFIISVSNDGTTFTQKHSGTSSGTTTSPEKYSLPSGTECRYVRVTVNGRILQAVQPAGQPIIR